MSAAKSWVEVRDAARRWLRERGRDVPEHETEAWVFARALVDATDELEAEIEAERARRAEVELRQEWLELFREGS